MEVLFKVAGKYLVIDSKSHTVILQSDYDRGIYNKHYNLYEFLGLLEDEDLVDYEDFLMSQLP